jgi:hypothetical protein
MTRLSSGWTLLLRLFFPVFYVVFMGAFTAATIIQGGEVSPVFSTWIYRIGMLTLLVLGVLTIRFTVWRLLRLDATATHFFITNYFKTFRYSRESIQAIYPFKIIFWNFIKIRLKEKGSLGQNLYVLLEHGLWIQYINSYPDLKNIIQSPGR